MLARLLNVDTIAGLGALAYAVAALHMPELAELVDPKAAFAFALAALARGLHSARKPQPDDGVLR